jgi:thymidylate synthase (FAD)
LNIKKHQIGLSWNEESRRYIDSDINLYLPDVIHSRPEGSIKQGSGEVHTNHITSGSDHHCTALEAIWSSSTQAVENYYNLLDAKVAPEEARMVLPLNSMTHIIWSGSLMAFMRVVHQRVDSHAQLAAQEFAKLLLPIIETRFPESVKAFGLSLS